MNKVVMEPVCSVSFGEYGGAELFFYDINGDGKCEIITYQGSAVFGAANIKNKRPYLLSLLPKSTCLSAFKLDGTRLWTWGEINAGVFVSHAYESCVSVGDINGDNKKEIVIADGSRVVVLDGLTGSILNEKKFDEDNYYIVQVLGQDTADNEAALVVKNGETGYREWEYGQPLLGLNAALESVWGPKSVPGAGHYILSTDINNDGLNEYLVGYSFLKPSGEIIRTLEGIDPEKINAVEAHVDYTDIKSIGGNGKRMLAIAGSDRIYLFDTDGDCLFSHSGPHVQGCALGRFRDDSEYQVAVYNAPDGPMELYDLHGKLIWQRSSSRQWPFPLADDIKKREFHRNRPIVASGGEKAWIIYADGGWPWGMDGNGKITLEFSFPAEAIQKELELPKQVRADDAGYGYAVQVLDVDGDGREEIVIYDRRYAWIYRIV